MWWRNYSVLVFAASRLRAVVVVVCRLLSVPATCQVYLRNGSVPTMLLANTPREKLKIQLVSTPRYTTTGSGGPGWAPSTSGVWQGSLLSCCLLFACWTSQHHASVSQGRIFSDSCTCCHTDIKVADQICYLAQSQYTDIMPTSPNADPITPGSWHGSHSSTDFQITGMT